MTFKIVNPNYLVVECRRSEQPIDVRVRNILLLHYLYSHRLNRQLFSSSKLRHSIFSVPLDDSSHPVANSSSIAINPPSCHLRHRLHQSTSERLSSPSRATITGLPTVNVNQSHHLRFYANVYHSTRLSAEVCVTTYTNLRLYSLRTIRWGTYFSHVLWGDKVLRGACVLGAHTIWGV